jgi:signal peptidase II
MTKRQAIFWVVFIGMLALDQWVKAWVRGAIPEHGSFGGKPFPGIFEITLTYNQGIAFGMFQGAGILLAPIAVVIACGAIWYSMKHPEETGWSHLAMGLLAAGALGNLYDRLFRKQVTDMFYLTIIKFPVFNVADSCITIATILLIITWWKEAARQKSLTSSPSETPTTES